MVHPRSYRARNRIVRSCVMTCYANCMNLDELSAFRYGYIHMRNYITLQGSHPLKWHVWIWAVYVSLCTACLIIWNYKRNLQISPNLLMHPSNSITQIIHHPKFALGRSILRLLINGVTFFFVHLQAFACTLPKETRKTRKQAGVICKHCHAANCDPRLVEGW